MKLNRLNKGRYSVTIKNIPINIEHQYSYDNWVAYSDCGKIDLESETLTGIRVQLGNI